MTTTNWASSINNYYQANITWLVNFHHTKNIKVFSEIALDDRMANQHRKNNLLKIIDFL